MTPILARTLAAIALLLALIIHADLTRIHADLKQINADQAASEPECDAPDGGAR